MSRGSTLAISAHVAALARGDGLAKPGVRPTGLPWQEPDGGFASVGRTDLFEAVDREGPGGGRTDDRRSDFSDVYGDWESVKDAAALTGGPVRPERAERTIGRWPLPRRIRATSPTSTR